MDAPKKARVLNRNRSAELPQSQRGERQIVVPMTREQFDDRVSTSLIIRIEGKKGNNNARAIEPILKSSPIYIG